MCLLTGGETEDEQVRVDMMENQAMDFRNGFVKLCYTPDFVCATSWSDHLVRDRGS